MTKRTRKGAFPEEPALGDEFVPSGSAEENEPELRVRIQTLLDREPFAVLCTQGGGQPYGALVAFAFTDDLAHLVFATPVTTRKYRLLRECDRVAVVVDSRAQTPGEITTIEAVTVTGRAVEIEREGEDDRWERLLLSRHPYLRSFVRASSCALFRVDTVRYLHVVRFQEVRQWIPGTGSSR